MANKKYEETDIQAIADTIREKTGSEESFKVRDMASGVNEVYDKGRNDEMYAFWDKYLKDSRENPSNVRQTDRFSGSCWNDDTFYPTQDIHVRYGYRMFYYSQISNLKQRLEDCGVKLIFEGANDVGMMFESMPTTELPTIELHHSTLVAGQTQRLCYNCNKLVAIEKIIAVETNRWGNSFYNCRSLTNVIFEGDIGTSISFSYSPLTVESMKSIITHLKDYSGTTSEFAYSLTLSSASKTALEAEGATSPNGNTWSQYVDDLGWTLL